MRQKDRALLHDLLSVQSQSRRQGAMIDFMSARLTEFGMDVVKAGEQLYARKGDHALHVPYFVAHADTVHRIVPDDQYRVTAIMATDGDIIYRAYDPTTGLSRGVGGDDKCGLYACLVAAQELDDVGVLVTIDEEIGCIGAGLVHEELLIRPGCLIQLDRRGNSDAVHSIGDTIMSQAFRDLVSPLITRYGYSWTHGMITDVGTLSTDLMLSAINLSAGYFLPHTDSEYISETDLEFAVELALEIAFAAAHTEWTIPADELRYRLYRKGGRIDYGYGWEGYEDREWGYAEWQERNAKPAPAQPVVSEFVETFFLHDAEMYEQTITLRGEKYIVYVELDRPQHWQFEDTTIYDVVTGDEEEAIDVQVMRYWIDHIEPVLIAMSLDDVDEPEPATYRPLASRATKAELEQLIRDVVESKDIADEMCGVEGCAHAWVRYDVLSKMYLCHGHYAATSQDPPELQKMVQEQTDILLAARGSAKNTAKMVRDLTTSLQMSWYRANARVASPESSEPQIVA